MKVTRRRFGAIASGFLAASTFGEACLLGGESAVDDGRLTARPGRDSKTRIKGEQALGLGESRDAILHLPATIAGPLPLVVMFHGAGGSGQGVLRRIVAAADVAGVAVLAPDSRGQTWDAIRGLFSADIPFVDRALTRVFEMVAIDPDRVTAAGFSDGASYAISLGLINGDLFSRVVAFSPGFVLERTPHGKPRFYCSHGTEDTILPIDKCSRIIVPALRRRGYDVTFKQFIGGHELPPPIAREAMTWAARA